MKVEDIPIKSDLTPQTDPRHQLNAAEVNALVEQTISNKEKVSKAMEMKDGYKTMALRLTRLESLITQKPTQFILNESRLDYGTL